MKMTLIQRELWQHVTGEATLSENYTSEEEERFKNKESKALATIALDVEPGHQVHILDCAKASDAWEALQKIFEKIANKNPAIEEADINHKTKTQRNNELIFGKIKDM